MCIATIRRAIDFDLRDANGMGARLQLDVSYYY
jgi:hypothetical protein